MASPWYRRPNDPPPFTLARKLDVKNDVGAAALFPWDVDDLKMLWDGQLDDPEHQPAWEAMAARYHGLLALAVADTVVVVSALQDSPKAARRIRLPRKKQNEKVEPVSCVCWALNTRDLFEPLIVYTAGSLIYIFHLKQNKLVGCLLGHGKAITSITTHPRHPYLFCTTSRDGTTRIYDLTRTPIQKPNNPPWSSRDPAPSLAGAAHGLHTTEPEGTGIGRCVAVLVGGRSGGHQAAVLGASFHPTHPLIATCGLDRCVKIWRLPSLEGTMLSREDKPLFSSSVVHKARVMSISWLSQDLLLSHSAPAVMCRDIREPLRDAIEKNNLYEEPGTMQVWRWLGFNRFFPPNQPLTQTILRGCASDYQESASFRVMTSVPLPYPPTSLQCKYFATDTHDPLVLLPVRADVRMLNLSLLQPPPPPPFRLGDFEDADPPGEQGGNGNEGDGGDGGGGVGGKWQPTLGWELSTDFDADENVGGGVEPEDSGIEKGDVQVLEMGLEGRVVVAAAQNIVSIWEMNP
ncbi:WD40 repeat-like protein [Dentipellis sp. KUC8613]|nr:WD40 repeat-like protein [Dentipellis sp. KUC8613]